jgi:hypothetical protein
LVAATDRGVYATGSAAGAATSWSLVGTGLPAVQVQDLDVEPDGLYAVTHGRGAWKLPAATEEARADLAVTAHARERVTVGRNFQFRAVVRNLGPDPATDVVVSLGGLSDQVNLVAVDCAPTPAGEPVPTSCTFPTLAPGASVAVRFVFNACCPFGQPDETITSSVVVSSDTTDPNLANNEASAASVLQPPSADLAIAVHARRDVVAGRTFQLRAVVRNLGPDAAVNAVVALGRLPGGERLVGLDCDGGAPRGAVACGFDRIAPGAQVAVRARLASPHRPGRRLVNAMSVRADTPDPALANNADSTQTRVSAR